MTTSMTEHGTLQDTMSKLEMALLAPVVSGELPAWIRNVEEAAATFSMDCTRHLNTVQHEQYREIAKSDPELLPQVEKLIEADQHLLEGLTRFHEELHALSKQAEEVGWLEGKLAARRQHVEDTGTKLILQIKKQQAAATTWLSEAVYRDRGTVD